MKTSIVDLSAIYRRNWHASEGENVNSAARKTLSFVRSLYANDTEIIVALDAPPYKRSEIYPEYKANRPQMSEAIKHELKKTIDSIANDGWKIARCQGYEADDVIATLVKNAEGEVLVHGTDKDLLQCTDLIEPYTSKEKTPENTLNVTREQVVDYLTLIGDSSDNIKGVKGVGAKTAVALLENFGSIGSIYSALQKDETQFKPATVNNLRDAMGWIDTTRQIIQLSDDLDLEIEQKEIDRSKEVIADMEMENENCEVIDDEEETAIATTQHAAQSAIVRTIDVEYKNSLEPAGIDELWRVSSAMHQSGLYGNFMNPQGIMAAIMHGRELGLGAAASLSSICVIKGRPTLYAETMVAMVKASPKCEYLQCTERTPERSTWKTQRVGDPEPTIHSVTYEEADKICPDGKRTQLKAQPATMIMWKAAAAICRMVYPDVTKGLHATEEF